MSDRKAIRGTATDAIANPAWLAAPVGSSRDCLAIWKRVSVLLQRSLHEWIPAEYFGDLGQFAGRKTAFSVIAYQAARIYRGPRRDWIFTYDLRDSPAGHATVAYALTERGSELKRVLRGVQRRLSLAGMADLARSYDPRFYKDILATVIERPRPLFELLAAESQFITAVIELGLNKTPGGVERFAAIAWQSLGKVHGMNMRHLVPRAIEETTRILTSALICQTKL